MLERIPALAESGANVGTTHQPRRVVAIAETAAVSLARMATAELLATQNALTILSVISGGIVLLNEMVVAETGAVLLALG